MDWYPFTGILESKNFWAEAENVWVSVWLDQQGEKEARSTLASILFFFLFFPARPSVDDRSHSAKEKYHSACIDLETTYQAVKRGRVDIDSSHPATAAAAQEEKRKREKKCVEIHIRAAGPLL